jgi:L-rhamnose isomerase/sugar isomerase
VGPAPAGNGLGRASRKFARDQGIQLGAINPNLFQEREYMLGSCCHPDEKVRRKAAEHLRECAEIAEIVGSSNVSVWLADGTNYPGQDDIRERRHRLQETLRAGYEALPPGATMLIEYKMFEPGFYTTDLPDWGTAYTICQALGDQAKVLVDTGHHAQGTNIEFIVATLLDEKRLGGFHFNDRRYADDDLIVGSANPFQLFLIFHELINGNDGKTPRRSPICSTRRTSSSPRSRRWCSASSTSKPPTPRRC